LRTWQHARAEFECAPFVTEPFDFSAEYERAIWKQLSTDVSVPIVGVKQLLDMKRAAARPQDLADIAELLSLNDDET
jgi:hypothetical protein